MSKIIIDVSMFDEQGNLYIINNEGKTEYNKIIPVVDDLPAAAANLAHTNNINYIGISTTPAYGEIIKEKIQNILITEYSNNNITIEVI